MRRLGIVFLISGIIGLALGLFVGWVQFPVQTINAPMPNLSPADKTNYTIMVAESYELNGDLQESKRQIAQLGIPDVGIYVRQLTENLITTTGSSKVTDIRSLVALATGLGQATTLMQPYAFPLATATGIVPRQVPNSQ
jgi:hypothetical protein